MWRLLFCVFIISFGVESVYSVSRLCDNTNEGQKTLSCTTQILGESHNKNDICKLEVIPGNNPACSLATFQPLMSNGYVGGVTLRPYVMSIVHNESTLIPYVVNHTVLNITFSNIKWKTMRFRFQDKYKNTRNHCRNIYISKDATIDDKSVLYYDCYWTVTGDKEGQSHTLDFEATYDDGVVNGGQYYFNVPTAESLSSNVKDENWKPFIYIEFFPSLMRLHILPPQAELKITAYNITVMKQHDDLLKHEEVQRATIYLKNRTDDVVYDYNYVGENGVFYFVVTPIHKKCASGAEGKCKVVVSPKIVISSEFKRLNICIASGVAFLVATLFAYYVTVKFIRRHFCKDYKLTSLEILPLPTKVLVVYSPINRLHAECVASFVAYLRADLGFEVLYDGDISTTSNGDPYDWAQEAFRLASHVMYIVGPKDDKMYNIYDKPLSAHIGVDRILLSSIKSNRGSKEPKQFLNVFFDYSNGEVPIETRHDPVFFLLKDWQKLIAFLSKNLLPKQQIKKTEKGRSFLNDLDRAKELLSRKTDDVIIRCDKSSDKKILL